MRGVLTWIGLFLIVIWLVVVAATFKGFCPLGVVVVYGLTILPVGILMCCAKLKKMRPKLVSFFLKLIVTLLIYMYYKTFF